MSDLFPTQERKEMEKNAPMLAAKKAEEERMAKLAAMPAWKREIAIKKGGPIE